MATNNHTGIPQTTVVRDLRKFDKETGNIYESLAIISKRANQISAQVKEELHSKLSEFTNDSDTLEEVFETIKENNIQFGNLIFYNFDIPAIKKKLKERNL